MTELLIGHNQQCTLMTNSKTSLCNTNIALTFELEIRCLHGTQLFIYLCVIICQTHLGMTEFLTGNNIIIIVLLKSSYHDLYQQVCQLPLR
jgi:hypothetical protein